MAWLFWIVEMLIPATMALFGALTSKAGHKKASRALFVAGALLAAVTVGIKLWAPLAPALQSMVDIGGQLLVFLIVALYAGRELKKH